MDRSLFYKVAFLLAVASLVPLVIFLSRRESPPEKISVKVHDKQTVENFTLTSSGERRWLLRAPVAIFEDRERIRLKEPVLEVEAEPPVLIRAKEALFNKAKGVLYLKGVELTSGNLEAGAPSGVYYVKRELFDTKAGCTFRLKDTNSNTTGNHCQIFVKEREVIITNHVRTEVFEVKQ